MPSEISAFGKTQHNFNISIKILYSLYKFYKDIRLLHIFILNITLDIFQEIKLFTEFINVRLLTKPPKYLWVFLWILLPLFENIYIIII